MITRNELKDVLLRWEKTLDEKNCIIDMINDNLQIDITDSPIVLSFDEMEQLALEGIAHQITEDKKEFEKVLDTLTWYYYEYRYWVLRYDAELCETKTKMWTEDNTPICYDLDSLIDYLLK